MIRRDIVQGTPEWHEWRRGKITASDIPSIIGDADFSTPTEVWAIKTGRAKEKESNYVMQRGSDVEPRVRALYALENDVDVSPVLAEHDEVKFLGASLDGHNEEYEGWQGLVVEIKYPGKEKHQKAVNGIVPECYRAQIQVQMACANAKYCDYVSYDGESIAVVRVMRDNEYFMGILPKLIAFWNCVLTDTPPPLTDRDFMVLEDDDSRKIFEEWRSAKLIMMQIEDIPETGAAEFSEAKKRLEAARLRVQAKMLHPKIKCSGVKVITKKTKTGSSIDIRFDETGAVS